MDSQIRWSKKKVNGSRVANKFLPIIVRQFFLPKRIYRQGKKYFATSGSLTLLFFFYHCSSPGGTVSVPFLWVRSFYHGTALGGPLLRFVLTCVYGNSQKRVPFLEWGSDLSRSEIRVQLLKHRSMKWIQKDWYLFMCLEFFKSEFLQRPPLFALDILLVFLDTINSPVIMWVVRQTRCNI